MDSNSSPVDDVLAAVGLFKRERTSDPQYIRVSSQEKLTEIQLALHTSLIDSRMVEPNLSGIPFVIAGSPDDASRQLYRQQFVDVG